jgi:hypothetical protein
MEWSDGTLRTVHVDPVTIMTLRKHISQHVKVVKNRVAWLGTGSRRAFGTLVEDVVTLVIDASTRMKPFWHQTLQHIKLVLAEQVGHVGRPDKLGGRTCWAATGADGKQNVFCFSRFLSLSFCLSCLSFSHVYPFPSRTPYH